MSNREAVRAAREATIRDARDVESESGAHHHRGRLEHLGHAWRAEPSGVSSVTPSQGQWDE